MNWGLDTRSPSANYSRPKRIFRLRRFGILSIDETIIAIIAFVLCRLMATAPNKACTRRVGLCVFSPVPAATPARNSRGMSPEFPCPPNFPTSASGTTQVLLIDEAPQDCFPTDTAKITTVALEGNILKINVTYQGGCQGHTFGLHGETAFLLSDPPQWSLYLSHDAYGDTCKENLEKLLSFDLTPMDKDRAERQAHPLLLRIIGPAGGSFANEPYMPLIEWP